MSLVFERRGNPTSGFTSFLRERVADRARPGVPRAPLAAAPTRRGPVKPSEKFGM